MLHIVTWLIRLRYVAEYYMAKVGGYTLTVLKWEI